MPRRANKAKRNGADPARIDAMLDLGVRDTWYPVMPSWAVSTAPVGITRLGERLVAWRDQAGKVHLLEDRCPHRGSRLSLGWNRGDRLACWYHGLQVGTDGTVLRVPAVPSCVLEGKQTLRAYETREAAGAVFAYFGAAISAGPTRRCSLRISSARSSWIGSPPRSKRSTSSRTRSAPNWRWV